MELGIPGIEDAGPVGAGGAAVVHRARRAATGEVVAVKVFAADEDPRRVERERLAAQAMADDDGVVPVHGTGVTTDGRPYLLMALMPGGDLVGRVREGGPLPPARAAELGIRLARTVAEAHRRGVRHRDIKPQNVLFDARGLPRLSDFGIADLGQRTFRTADGTISGTVSYMAPEVIRGDQDGAAADLYSLAATVYFAVEGRHLFTARPGESYEAMVFRRGSAAGPVPFSARTPPWLRRVLLRALAAEPGQRHPSVAAFAEALRAAGGSALRFGHRGRPRPPSPGRPRPGGWASPAGPAAAGARRRVLRIPGRWPAAPTGPAPGPVAPAGPRTASVVLGLVAALVLILIGVGLAAGRRPPPSPPGPAAASTSAATTAGTAASTAAAADRPDASWQKVGAGTALRDLAAIRAASGQADPAAGIVAFHLWGPDIESERAVAWLARPGQQRISLLLRMVDGRLERSELPPEQSWGARLFPLSSVRFDLLPALAGRARQACSAQAPGTDVTVITVAMDEPPTGDQAVGDQAVGDQAVGDQVPVIRFELLDPRSGRTAEVAFTAAGRLTTGPACRFA